MLHPGRDVKLASFRARPAARSKPHAVVEQRLLAADHAEQRLRAGEVAEHRRRQRIARDVAREVLSGHLEQARTRAFDVPAGVPGHARARAGQVGPGRDRPRRRRAPRARGRGPQGRRPQPTRRQTSCRRWRSRRNAGRRRAGSGRPRPRPRSPPERDARAPAGTGHQHRRARRLRQVPGGLASRRRGAEHVAATEEIEHRCSRSGGLRDRPQTTHLGRRAIRHAHRLGGGGFRPLARGAPRGQGQVDLLRRRAHRVPEGERFPARHRRALLRSNRGSIARHRVGSHVDYGAPPR